MSIQTFPPRGFLKTLDDFRVEVDVGEHKQFVDPEVVATMIGSVLKGDGFKCIPAGQPCRALLRCRLVMFPTASDGGGKPIAFAYFINMDVVVSVNPLPLSELFIAWIASSCGTVEPTSLCNRILAACVSNTSDLVAKLKEARQ